jgi:hypothetical protein
MVTENPEQANSTIVATYTTPTSLPLQIKYLYTLDQNIILTFYPDVSYFLVRTITTVAAFAASYATPTTIPYPAASGCQCACFNQYDSVVFILDNSGNILIYSVLFGTTSTLASTGYSGMTDCYYESDTNSLVLVSSGVGGTNFYRYDLVSLAQIGTYNTG